MNDVNNFIYLNERKDVWLLSQSSKSCRDLWKIFKKLGFTRHYDVFSFERMADDITEIWQDTSIVNVSVFNDEQEVYFGDEIYNAIQFEYLLPSLPRKYISTFTQIVGSISEELNIPLEYDGSIISKIELENDLMKSADEFAEKVSEPGG